MFYSFNYVDLVAVHCKEPQLFLRKNENVHSYKTLYLRRIHSVPTAKDIQSYVEKLNLNR